VIKKFHHFYLLTTFEYSIFL